MSGPDDESTDGAAEPTRAGWTDLTGDARGEAYDARWARLEDRGQSVHGEADLVDHLLGRRPPGAPNAVVLDAGCGTGRVAVELVRRGHRIIGVDRAPGHFDPSRCKAPLTLGRRSSDHGAVLVCHCRVVNHRQIEAAALCGARSIREVVGACGAGGVCGGCRPAIAEILEATPVTVPDATGAVA